MKTNTASKTDFLDDVVDDMGDGKGGSDYGADMDEEDEGSDEETQQDRVMAARQVGKALGLGSVDAAKLAEALEAFVKTCM